jgi:hypothetical protein
MTHVHQWGDPHLADPDAKWSGDNPAIQRCTLDGCRGVKKVYPREYARTSNRKYSFIPPWARQLLHSKRPYRAPRRRRGA